MSQSIRRLAAGVIAAALAVTGLAASSPSGPVAAQQPGQATYQLVRTTDGPLINFTYSLGGETHSMMGFADVLVNGRHPSSWTGEGRWTITAVGGCRIVVDGHVVSQDTGPVARCAVGPLR